MAAMSKRTFRFLPLTIRIETLGGVGTPLVLRGTPLPTKRSELFTTAVDNQSSVEVQILMGESALARNNIKLGSFQLQGIPSNSRGVAQIKVEFSVDGTCAVTARASVEAVDVAAEQTFEPQCELTDDYIAKILTGSEPSRADDDNELRQIEAINRANALIAKAEEKLEVGPQPKLSEAIAALGLGLASGDSDVIRERSDALESLLSTTTYPFTDMFTSLFGPPNSRRPTVPSGSRPVRSNPAKPSQKVDQQLTSTPDTRSLGRIFGGGNFTLDPQLCFVIMPFADKFQTLYNDHIRPVVERAGLRCERADEIRGTALITWDIWERINRARLLIAELTDQNSNVFYELGLAHALSKDVIPITQSMDFVPFDLKALRCICYDFTPRGVGTLEKDLNATIQAVMRIG